MGTGTASAMASPLNEVLRNVANVRTEGDGV